MIQLLILWYPCSASYRDLLGTAESIIEMGVQMEEVENYMGEIGKRCNTRILDKKASNLRTWTEEVGAPSTNASEKSRDLWRGCLRLFWQTVHATPLHPNWLSSAAARMSYLGF